VGVPLENLTPKCRTRTVGHLALTIIHGWLRR
jgi:hypothetical protein